MLALGRVVGLAGVITGKALYERRFTVAEALAARAGGAAAMKVARVIPCLDVTDGRVVKGVNFVGLRDAGDPVELARRYDAEGADELVFLDITASSDGRDTMVDVVRRTADEVFIPFTVGGGIRSVEDARRMLRAGADKVSVNTSAVRATGADRARSPRSSATQCVVCAIDARRRTDGTRRLGGVPPRRAHADGCRRGRVGRRGAALGAGEILLTSMDRDGTKHGFDTRADARGRRRGERAGRRQRRRRHARAPRRGHP